MNQHFYVRQGVSFKEMTDAQRDAAFGLDARLPQRQGPEAHARHHAAERDAGRTDSNDFDFLGEWLYSHHGHGQAVRNRAVGLAARRPSRHHQLLRARRPGGDDAVLRRIRAGDRDIRQIQGHGDPAGRAERRTRHAPAPSTTSSARRRSSSSRKPATTISTEAFKDNVVLDYAGVRVAELLGGAAQAAAAS